MIDITPFENRLRKNARHWKKWARRRGISCFRLYDRDIPEYPLAIDWYEGRVHVQEFARTKCLIEEDAETLAGSISRVLEIPREHLAFKTRQRQKGRQQYEKTGEEADSFTVHEGGLRFWVNLHAYLDTGLFLDHRQTRAMVRERAAGKRFLNLFAYTGSFTVYAAAGGATESVTVDLSNTYQSWSRQNFLLNGMDLKRHQTIRADVFHYLQGAKKEGERFDLIMMDPPVFSNSKKMAGILDVQRDHPRLIRGCLDLLTPDGALYFSNNFRKFKFDHTLEQIASAQEITHHTVPEDFKRHKSHRCWLIRPLAS